MLGTGKRMGKKKKNKLHWMNRTDCSYKAKCKTWTKTTLPTTLPQANEEITALRSQISTLLKTLYSDKKHLTGQGKAFSSSKKNE